MISSVLLKLKPIKMKQRNDLLNEIKDKLSNRYYLEQRDQELVNDCVDELLKAINYSQCCTQLKALDNDNFEDWIIVNGYSVFDDYYLKNDIAFSESDLIEMYNKEVMNL